MTVVGVIAERTRGILPATWEMLGQLSTFGDDGLRTAIDTVKERVMGNVIAPAAEGNYPLTVIDYLAKLAALELITPGIDAWHRHGPIQVGTTGTNEQTTYANPVQALEALRKELLAETRRLWPLVAPLITFRRVTSAARPALNTINDELLTPSPQEFGRPYRVTDFS